MNRTTAIGAAVVAALAYPAPSQSHHSGSLYDTTPLWISGTVVGFEPSNPHTLTTLESRQDDGSVRQWVVEGPPQTRLNRVQTDRYVPQAGDVIGFCAFPYKSREELAALFPDVDYSGSRWAITVDGSSPRLVTGHVMVTPDGERQVWEPHGVMAECIQSSGDESDVWLGVLNTNRSARQAWCQQKTYPVISADVSLSEFVEAFDDMLDAPCD